MSSCTDDLAGRPRSAVTRSPPTIREAHPPRRGLEDDRFYFASSSKPGSRSASFASVLTPRPGSAGSASSGPVEYLCARRRTLVYARIRRPVSIASEALEARSKPPPASRVASGRHGWRSAVIRVGDSPERWFLAFRLESSVSEARNCNSSGRCLARAHGPRAGRRSGAPASARRSSSSCCRRARRRGRSPGRPRTSRSVSIFAAFFGQAIQSPSAGSSVAFKAAKRRSSSARLVVKKTTTPAPGFAPSFCESGVPE